MKKYEQTDGKKKHGRDQGKKYRMKKNHERKDSQIHLSQKINAFKLGFHLSAIR